MNTEPLRVFLLEDSRTDVEIVLYHARQIGAEVVHAEAIADVGMADGCHVAILDLCVIGSEGCDTVRRFREVHPVMPVVVYTSEKDPRGMCEKEGADYFVHKDSGPRLLLQAMEQALENRTETLRRRSRDLPEEAYQRYVDRELSACRDSLLTVQESLPDIC